LTVFATQALDFGVVEEHGAVVLVSYDFRLIGSKIVRVGYRR
jgi:hypothetical protein